MLILLRHGQSVDNAEKRMSGRHDTPLSDLGRQQAKEAGEELVNLQIDAVFHSPSIRAVDTMKLALPGYQGPVTASEAIMERSYGLLEGVTWKEAQKLFPPRKYKFWEKEFHEAPPHGESFADVELRVVGYFRKEILPLLEDGKNVLMVFHGNAIKVLIGYLNDLKNSEVFELQVQNAMPIFINHWDPPPIACFG